MKARRLILGAVLALLLAAFPAASPAAAACPAPTTGYPGAVMGTSGLAAYWRLGETSGTTACDATGVNSGTYQGAYSLGAPGGISGDSNTAVSLDGNTGQVSVPDSSSLDTGDAFSIEAWVKRDSPGGGVWEVIVSKQSGSWLLMFDESDRLVLRRAKYSNIAYSVGRVTDTNWHYVAATKNGGAVNLYIDGKASNGSIANATMTDNTSPLAIGQSNASSFFNGTIDDLAVYNSVLTPSQIASPPPAGAAPAPAPPPAPPPTPAPTPPPPSGSDPVIGAAGD